MNTSDAFGALSTFQCLAISDLATKRICVITTNYFQFLYLILLDLGWGVL